MMPVYVRMFGFGKYSGVTLSQQFLDIDWKKIYKIFSKNNRRLKRRLLTKIHNRVDIRRIKFDRDRDNFNNAVLDLPVPRKFSTDSAFQDMKRNWNASLDDYDLGNLATAYDKHLTKLKERKKKLRKIKKLFLLFHKKAVNTLVFWKLFGKRWFAKRKKRKYGRNFKRKLVSKRVTLKVPKSKNYKKRTRIFKKGNLALRLKIMKQKIKKSKSLSKLRIRKLSRKMNREPVGMFWVRRGRLVFGEVLKKFFFVLLSLNACNICFGRIHNVSINLSARLLSLYLATKIKQGFSIKSLIKTWRRSIRHFLGCIGWKICFSGRFETNRLRGRATYVWVSEGRIPVSNFGNIERLDYAATTSVSRYGSCGFKVWLYIDRLRYSHKLEEKRPTM